MQRRRFVVVTSIASVGAGPSGAPARPLDTFAADYLILTLTILSPSKLNTESELSSAA